jgi:hypothetical protein
MMPHGGDLVVSSPLNPVPQMRKSAGKTMRNTKKEIMNFTNVGFA